MILARTTLQMLRFLLISAFCLFAESFAVAEFRVSEKKASSGCVSHGRSALVPGRGPKPTEKHRFILWAYDQGNRPKSVSLALSVRGGDGNINDSPVEGTTPRPSTSVVSYYLLWSPGALKKMLYTLMVLASLRLASPLFQDQLNLLSRSVNSSSGQFFLQTVILPLLSSACCGIQLLINALVGAGGCAGFNKYLGPLRPYFLGLLIFATLKSFAHQESMIRWTLLSSLRLFVAFMPEMVHLWNVNASDRLRRRHSVQDHRVHVTIELALPSMGCVACINKIDSSLHQCAPNQITEAKSWLEPSGKGGRSLVKAVATTQEDAYLLAQSLVEAVQSAGFAPCTIDSFRIEEAPDHDGPAKT